jgi:hypothetical protein
VTQVKQLTEKPIPPKAGSAPKKPGLKPGRKRSTTKGSKARAGSGGARLRSSINKKVREESDAIAQALIDKAVAGNMTSTRLVVGISGADKAPPVAKKSKKKTKTSLYIQRLANEPEWEGPWEDEDGKRDASRLPPSDYDLPPDLK